MIKFSVKTHQRDEFVNMTETIASHAQKQKWQNGVLTVYVPHTIAGVTIQENADPDVTRDLTYLLDKTFPWSDRNYRHAEGNTAAHMKTSTMGSSVQVILDSGDLQLGTWQAIFFCEFDGPRSRNVWLTFNERTPLKS